MGVRCEVAVVLAGGSFSSNSSSRSSYRCFFYQVIDIEVVLINR